MAVVINGTSGITGNTGTLISASTIGVGGTTPSASGAGITFPATQNPSSDANTLDDYEEGTWTPTCVSTGQTINYSTRGGTYTRIGNTVRAECAIVISSVSGTTSGTTITGLPFANAGESYTGLGIIGYNDGFAATVYSAWIQSTTGFFRAGTKSSGNDSSGFAAGYVNVVWIYKA